MAAAILMAGLVTAGLNPGAAAAATKTTIAPCRPDNAGCFPASFAFAPKGRIFYVERFTGQIRVFKMSTGVDSLWATVPGVATSGEQGLLGIAVDPRWKRAKRFRWIYVYFTAQGSPEENRIVRFRKRRGVVTQDLLARIPAAVNHNGGVIGFGPDGKLYAVTGDAVNPANSQTNSNLAGKVLRMNKNGRVPDDNPRIGGRRTRIWSFGHRNSFGFTFDPFTRRGLWQTENGPECDDELNRIVKRGNYGWGPASACPGTTESGPSPRAPAMAVSPVALTGAAFCKDCGVPGLEGALLYGSFCEPGCNDGTIRAVGLTGDRKALSGAPVLVLDHPSGIVGMKRYKGRIYFSDPSGIHRLDP